MNVHVLMGSVATTVLGSKIAKVVNRIANRPFIRDSIYPLIGANSAVAVIDSQNFMVARSVNRRRRQEFVVFQNSRRRCPQKAVRIDLLARVRALPSLPFVLAVSSLPA